MTPDFIGAFFIGLLGAGHCIGMCGGIASMLSFSNPSASALNKVSVLLFYNTGRLFSYAMIGGVIGMAIASLADFSKINHLLIGLRLLAGIFMIGLGLYVGRWWFGLLAIEKLGQVIWKPIAPLAKSFIPLKKTWYAIPFGMLWGWLPCGLVYSMLTWSAVSGSATNGALIMFCFGLGTLPAMLCFGGMANTLKNIQRSDLFRKISALFIMAYGIYTVLDALKVIL